MVIDKPKVAILLDRLGSGAGGEASLIDFALAFANRGCKVDVLVARSSVSQRHRLREFLDSEGPGRDAIQVIPVARTLDFYVARSVTLSDFVPPRRHRLIAARFLIIPTRLKVKKSLRAADIVISSQVLSGTGLNELKLLSKKAKLILNHNGDPHTFSEKWKTRERFVGSDPIAGYEQYLSRFDEILFQSDGQQEEFRELHPFISAGLTTIWPSCNEKKCSEWLDSSSPFGLDEFNFVYVAKIQPTKKQFELIEAFSRLALDFPKSTLTLVGGSINPQDYLDKCKSFVMQSGLTERVRFTGYRDDSCRFTYHSDVIVHPSIAEGVSRAIREAAFLGKPIVCSNLTGLRTFLGTRGAIYFNESSADVIEDALRIALQGKRLLEQISQNAYDAYQTKAEWKRFEGACFSLVGRLYSGPIESG